MAQQISSAPVASGSAAPVASGSAALASSVYVQKSSTFVHKPKPTGSQGGNGDDDDCSDDEGYQPSAAPYTPQPSGAPVAPVTPGPYTPPTGGWKATNGSAAQNNYTDATPSYQPLQSNDGARFTMGALGAVVAFAAAIMVL